MNWKMSEEGDLLSSFEQFTSMTGVLNRIMSSLHHPYPFLGFSFLPLLYIFFTASELES